MSLEDALALVVLRSRLLASITGGAMLSVPMPPSELQAVLPAELALAAVNAPELCAVSGPASAVAELERQLGSRGVECRRLRIAAAAHSPMLDPVLDAFRKGVQGMRLQAPQRPFVSNLTGTWATEAVADPEYWVRHLRQTVRFADGMSTLLADGDRAFIEVGPGTTLCSLVRMHSSRTKTHEVLASMRHPQEVVDDRRFLLSAVGRLWAAGREIDWARVRGPGRRLRVPLPTYAFDHQRCWIEPGKHGFAGETSDGSLTRIQDVKGWFSEPVWQRTALPPPQRGSAAMKFLLFADEEGLVELLAEQLVRQGHDVVTVSRGPAFTELGRGAFGINPAERADYARLLEELAERRGPPDCIVHGWTVRGGKARELRASVDEMQVLGFYSLLFLFQALAEVEPDVAVKVVSLTSGMQAIEGEPLAHPECATVLGPLLVAPREFPRVTTRSIDVGSPPRRFGRRSWRSAETGGKALVPQLAAEIAGASEDQAVAFRQTGRFTSALAQRPVPRGEPRLRERGVYLITGGLGGIGLAVADWLARTARARLALLSRTGLPPRADWDALLRSRSPMDPDVHAISAILAMEAAGAEVIALRADVADAAATDRAVAETIGRFGALHGVVHAAGVIQDELMQQKRPEAAERVFAPKVRGTVNLDVATRELPLDFFVLFSSTSSLLGLPGQVDYAAANAFLNAFARSRASADRAVVAVNWGAWRDVGMAVRAVQDRPAAEVGVREMKHPWLGECVRDLPDHVSYRARYRVADLWLLDHHRIKGGGAVLPGTGYLELVRAAFDKDAGSATIDVADLTFISPLRVDDAVASEVAVDLTRRDGGHEVAVCSRREGDSAWQEHARGRVAYLSSPAPARLDLAGIQARCTVREVTFGPLAQETKQERHLDFGPRWKVLRRLRLGDGEAIAYLQLGHEFAADCAEVPLHPSLLDLACHVGLPLIPGYAECDDLFVPLAIKRVLAFARLPDRVWSHVRLRPGADAKGETAGFDVTVCDESGNVLVEIEEFLARRLRSADALARPSAEVDRPQRRQGAADGASEAREATLLREVVRLGITREEGVDALARVLSGAVGPHVYVSPLRLPALVERVHSDAHPAEEAAGRFVRPELETTFAAPSTVLETELAGLWSEALGVERVGIDDDFFELGGQSLIAVRMFSRLRKQHGVDFGLATLFEAPTVRKLAALLQTELGPAAAVKQPRQRAQQRRGWSTLVPIQPKGTRPPFYCAAGQGGNAMNLRHLALHLGEDQPFYGLQARGVDGRHAPHETVEAMAQEYVDDIRRFQPHGPYYIGGYSGGGTAAYEVAQRLRALGETVAALVFLDSFSPAMPRRGSVARAKLHMRRLLQQGPSYAFEKVRDRLVGTELFALRRLLVGALAKLFPYRFRNDRMLYSWVDAFKRYDPRPYDGSATLFRVPIIERIHSSGVLVQHDLGWGALVKDLTVVEVPGDHNSMCEEPYVRLLAERVRESLAVGAARPDAPQPAASQSTREPVEAR
jgi:thioesterase domain-containing protein/NAD(P)-dependent dehydrogenase (short-subunit alcohol dehydrogenase family)